MDISVDEIIVELRKVMGSDFETRSSVFSKYENILEEKLKLKPDDVKVISVLAMLNEELRKSSFDGFKRLKNCYENYKDTLDDDSFSMLVTNLAYFLIEEIEFDFKKAETLLLEAINRNSKYVETYYALGRLYFEKDEYIKASQMFKIAFDISGNNKYKYSEAVCFMKNGEFQKAVDELRLVYCEDLIDDNSVVETAKYLSYALVELGEFEESKTILSKLMKFESKVVEIHEIDLINLLFMNGNYEECVRMYDDVQFAISASWLYDYFYALRQLGKSNVAEEKFKEIILKMETDLEFKRGNLVDWDSQEELDEYIKSELEEIADIKKCYDDVFRKNVVVTAKPQYYIVYDCYYINCPRHYQP